MKFEPLPNANPNDCKIIPIPLADPKSSGTVLLNNDEWDDIVFAIENDINDDFEEDEWDEIIFAIENDIDDWG